MCVFADNKCVVKKHVCMTARCILSCAYGCSACEDIGARTCFQIYVRQGMGHTPEEWCCRQPLLRARKPVPGKRITHQKAAHTITTQTPVSPNGSPLQVSCENKGQVRIGVGRSKENGMSSAVTSAAEKPHGAVHFLVQFSELVTQLCLKS